MDSGRIDETVTDGAAPEHLVILGTLAATLSPDELGPSLEAAVELLRAAVDADDCEIFLREPEGEDLVLAACCGSDRDALMEIGRFQTGAGFPGIVVATGTRLLTRHLDRDRRFLRRRLTEDGVVCFVSMPLPGPHGSVGCISMGWRNIATPIEKHAELLALAARPIATTVAAGLLAARDLVDRAIDAAGPELEAQAQACLDVITRSAHADGGTLVLYDAYGGETKVLATPDVVHVCADAVDGKRRCRLLAEGHGIALAGPRRDWPAACRCLPSTTVSPLCLPLRSKGRLHGVAVLDCGEAPPSPRGRDLVPLLTMAAAAAARLVTHGVERWANDAAPGSVTPLLELRCFGGFEVRVRGQRVPPEAFVRRKAITLLKLLVLSAGNPISRDALAERLWPGIDESAGANRLHGVLHALRSVIEPYREQRRWIFACTIGDLHYFNMEGPHWTDVFAFRRHVATAQDAERRGRREEAIRHLEAALGLYRGDLFGDEPYASWCELERSELRHRYIDLTGRLADLWIAERDSTRGIGWLRRGLLADPLREDLHQALIRALIAQGRRPEAWEQYQVCERLLRDELGAEPLMETRRLAQLVSMTETERSGPPSSSPSL